MVGGIWIYNYYGMIGSIFVISDARTTLCLFLGGPDSSAQDHQPDGIRGYSRMLPTKTPSSGAFPLSVFPTCGFSASGTSSRRDGLRSLGIPCHFSTMVMVIFPLDCSTIWPLAKKGTTSVAAMATSLTEEQTLFGGTAYHGRCSLLTATVVLVVGIYNQEIVNQIETFLDPLSSRNCRANESSIEDCVRWLPCLPRIGAGIVWR